MILLRVHPLSLHLLSELLLLPLDLEHLLLPLPRSLLPLLPLIFFFFKLLFELLVLFFDPSEGGVICWVVCLIMLNLVNLLLRVGDQQVMDPKGRLSLAFVSSTSTPTNVLDVRASKALAWAVIRIPTNLHVPNHLLKFFDVFDVFGCFLDLAKSASLTLNGLLLIFNALG